MLGQKGEIMLSTYRELEYSEFNLLEWMHNMARAFDNFNAFLVGKDKSAETRARKTSQQLGIFEDIWPDKIVYLSQVNYFFQIIINII